MNFTNSDSRENQKQKVKKKDIILYMFRECEKKNNYVFNNDFVKSCLKELGSSTNPYDMTKIDQLENLPSELVQNNWAIIHLGDGTHEFVHGIQNAIYHELEEIEEQNKKDWPYKASILNGFSSSENSILSLSFNQKILHDFLYGDPHNSNPKMYNAERKSRLKFDYKIGHFQKSIKNLQIEIDLTTELNGVVTIFEGKNIKNSESYQFNVHQIYNPFRYYSNLKFSEKLPIKEIDCCYLTYDKSKESISVYLYTFLDYLNIASIKLIKNGQYVLKNKK